MCKQNGLGAFAGSRKARIEEADESSKSATKGVEQGVQNDSNSSTVSVKDRRVKSISASMILARARHLIERLKSLNK